MAAMKIRGIILALTLGLGLSLSTGCGIKLGYRHFPGPIEPASTAIASSEQQAQYVIGDDHSITFVVDRLEITLLPLSQDMLNRQFATVSNYADGYARANPYTGPTNPYTYGEWKPPGEDEAPDRFTVFLLKVKNYAYPKVQINPVNIYITSPNGRRYEALSFAALVEYYWPYAVAYSGNARGKFSDRRDLIRRTLFRDDLIFSGQEQDGHVVFAPLDYDVEEFTVHIEHMPLRYDFKGEPVETIDIDFPFQREVYYAKSRPAEAN